MEVARGAGVLDQTFSETFNHPVIDEPIERSRAPPPPDTPSVEHSEDTPRRRTSTTDDNTSDNRTARERHATRSTDIGPEIPRCEGHDLPCVEREVNREGPNKGRKFFVCSLSQSEQCNFFAWASDMQSSTNPGVSIKCTGHDEPCVERTVRKEGPNKGRAFYSCRRGQAEGSCGFFVWKEEAESLTSRPVMQAASNSFTNVETEGPTCSGHDRPCALRTTRKPGENQNRQFFACAHPAVESCGFFLWKDEYEGQQQLDSTRPGRYRQPSSTSASSRRGEEATATNCSCGLPGILLTCKNGANKGRTFYKCPKPQGNQCDFFEWAS